MEFLGIQSWHLLHQAGVDIRQATLDEALGEAAPSSSVSMSILGMAVPKYFAHKRGTETGPWVS